MGVPSFYKWLVGKYPSIIVPAKKDDAGGVGESPNPNGVFDNLYLDMNGIIHPCFHPEDQVCPPTTFDEVFEAMFEYMDRLFRIVRPTKLLYLAVDGVAPRAKMNQQRSRRFKAAKDAKDAEMEENILRERFKAEGKEVLPRETYEVSDPNVITPGTEFMEKLSKALEYYIRARLNSDPGWKDIKVILSDSNVPGEGEHKIMSFIRAQRSRENYDPNTRHCLYGLDADLIMLALASHELHFSILREDVIHEIQPENCIALAREFFKTEESSRKCGGWFLRATEASPKGKIPKKQYQFLNIWVLREYLELDLMILNPIVKTDIERLIDDFIFICFLIGNDFISHIPSLEIHENAVDLLIEVYKTTFNKMGGYIVNTEKVKDKHAAYLKVSRLEKFIHELSMCEEKIFVKRYELRERLQRNILSQAAQKEWNERNFDNVEEYPDGPDLTVKSFSTQCSISTVSSDKSDITANTLELRRNLKDTLRNKQDLVKSGACKHDWIKLGLAGWKSRFYREKFGVASCNEVGKLKKDMVQKYLEGLCWVLQYYFADVPSWSWYYPFYYAPFASDLKGLSQFKISFTMDKPLRPFDQLMAVLPPESSCALPKCYRELMDSEESPIQKFYPSDLQIDTHGKRFLWQGITKLPFIDEKLLLSATKTVENDLAVHEMIRNTVRQEKIFLRNSNTLANNAAFVRTSDSSSEKLLIDPSTSELGGWLLPADDDGTGSGFFCSPIKDLEDIRNDQTLSFMFFNPELVKPIPRLLDHVKIPEKTLTEAAISKRPLWHTYPGSRPPATIASAVEAQPRISSFGRGRGSPFAAETSQWSSSGRSNGRGVHGPSMAQSRGSRFDSGGAYGFRPAGGAWAGRGSAHEQRRGAFQRQPVRPWARGDNCGGNGGGRGGSGQPRAW
ncbi:5'-3' exoribonuclease 2-like [Phragmites australis]|uniref:5'-3' exoribonuclease 2-like n=1 Tax=Phragmites australis TaxID=29695 RepID=UPI002D76B6DF|nr:5'-3' exoribonuclease 2-like [Phragmites australis]